MKEIVMLYHADEQETERMRRACEKAGIAFTTAGIQQELAPLGMLAGVRPEERAGHTGVLAGPDHPGLLGGLGQTGAERSVLPPLREPVIVMAGLSDSKLDELLAAMRSEQCRTSLKAVLTRYNADWNVRELAVQLTAERKAVGQGRRIHGI